MARTRSEIKALVVLNTGRSDKDTLMNSLCDTALKVAAIKHPFQDITSIPSDAAITLASTTVDISGTSNILQIVTVRLVETSGTRNTRLWLKHRQWWDEHIIEPDDQQQGWPYYGMKVGTNIVLDRPCQAGLSLRMRVETVPSFTDDDTECPIDLLDIFVEQYVTAFVFKSVEADKAFYFWKSEALGPRFDIGNIGGSLLQAVQTDSKNLAGKTEMTQVGSQINNNLGASILNNIIGEPNYGNTVWWK